MRERKILVLDYLPNGYPGMKKIEPIIQGIGLNHFALLELVSGVKVSPGDEVLLSDEETVKGIRRKLQEKDLTNFAKSHLEDRLAEIIKKREPEFVSFFNRATRLSIRTHQLELLPGIGKKHIQVILKERKNPFTSFEDIKKRVGMTVEIERLIAKRIVLELRGEEKNNLFIAQKPKIL
jgi:putative nucleotide binding protein